MSPPPPEPKVHFSEYFDIDPQVLRDHGALNISLINDLPLFVDPFLLFNSEKAEYRALHEDIIRYLRFLRGKAAQETLNRGSLQAWYTFHEVKQTWLGFSVVGNAGSGLGEKFARSLHKNLHTLFHDFGSERVARSSHLEKLCLVEDGIGRDNISDFATNLIKGFLLEYTQRFALAHLRPEQRRSVTVDKVRFSYDTEVWRPASFVLPHIFGDYVILTPRDLLTKDESWINRHDLFHQFEGVIESVPDEQLRAQLNNYLEKRLNEETGDQKKGPTEKERAKAIESVVRQFPAVLDHYLRLKEETGDGAKSVSRQKVEETEEVFVRGVRELISILAAKTDFYANPGSALEEARERVMFLKSAIEDMGGWRFFIGKNGEPIRRERDVQLLFRLTWFATTFDVNREVNNGRGPVDFKVSFGARNASLVEFKLASSSKLEANMKNQVGVYEKASGTKQSMKVIIYFTEAEHRKTMAALTRLELDRSLDVVLIDARPDNKQSASTVV